MCVQHAAICLNKIYIDIGMDLYDINTNKFKSEPDYGCLVPKAQHLFGGSNPNSSFFLCGGWSIQRLSLGIIIRLPNQPKYFLVFEQLIAENCILNNLFLNYSTHFGGVMYSEHKGRGLSCNQVPIQTV